MAHTPDQSNSGFSSLLKYIPIISLVVSFGAMGLSALKNNNSLEFMTKQDFAVYQLDTTKKTASLESTINSGFATLTQEIKSLNFVPIREFQDFKDKSTSLDFENQKQIDFLKKDLIIVEKELDRTKVIASNCEVSIAILKDNIKRLQDDQKK